MCNCKILEDLSMIGVIPVVKIDNAENALPIAEALITGGINCAEITFRTNAASESIRQISNKYPEMLLGAGTVLTVKQVDDAISAGAKFIVSPGLNVNIVNYCKEKNICIIPGCITPSEIELAIENGLNTLKFFPAEQSGGIEMIKALSAPYVNVKFLPTGGIGLDNILDYLKLKKVVACGGSFMISNNFNEITQLSKNAISKILGFELAHIGINLSDCSQASTIALEFEKIFNFPVINDSNSFHINESLEIMKSTHFGTNGHIAISTNFIHRAIYFLENKGVKFNIDSKKYDVKGNLVSIYLIKEIGGFAIHLLQKT